MASWREIKKRYPIEWAMHRMAQERDFATLLANLRGRDCHNADWREALKRARTWARRRASREGYIRIGPRPGCGGSFFYKVANGKATRVSAKQALGH